MNKRPYLQPKTKVHSLDMEMPLLIGSVVHNQGSDRPQLSKPYSGFSEETEEE